MEFVREGPEHLVEYESVDCAFTVSGRLNLDELRAGNFVAEAIAPYRKNYDDVPTERPTQVALRCDPRTWHILAAFSEGRRVGGVIVAPATNYPVSGCTPSDRVLVDIRVAPEARGHGLATRLLGAARSHAGTALLAETQDTNVGACQLYRAAGGVPIVVEPDGYPGFSDEAMIVWRFAPP